MTSGASLESHMTEISKTMLKLAQALERIANTQQSNHQTMINVQQEQANAFEALAATTQQQKYETMFAAVPRYDGKNKEEYAVWLNQISSLATSGGCSLRLELLNRSEGDVTTIIAGMDDTVDDLKEEIMRCFSNAPTMVQVIGVQRGIRQRHNEQACLYTARYEFIHNKAHNIQPEEQTQISELIHYASTLLPHLQRKLLKKVNSLPQPKSLREAMDVTMDMEGEQQITQHEQLLTIVETCYEETPMEETCTTEEVQTRSQAQKQGQQQHQGSHSQFLRHQNVGQKSFQGNQNYNKSNYGSGYKSQYNKGNGQYHGNKPSYQGQHQPVSTQAPIQQPRIDFGMILPMKFGLEQFLEMTKALKCIEDKYSKPPYNRHEPFTQGNNSNKENEQPNGSTQLTSQTSQHGQIT